MQKYTCSMHLQVIKDRPGKCPLCGMTLVTLGNSPMHTTHQHTENNSHHNASDKSFDKHQAHHNHTEDFLKRFWISLIVTIPILLLSSMIQQWGGFTLNFEGDSYVLLGLGTFLYMYGGFPFLRGMVGEVKAKAIGMMTLVALAISVAYIYSAAIVFGLKGMGAVLMSVSTIVVAANAGLLKLNEK